MWYTCSRIILNFTFIWKLFVKVIFKPDIKESYYIDIYLCIRVAVDNFPNLKVSNIRSEIIVFGAQDVRVTCIAVYKNY